MISCLAHANNEEWIIVNIVKDPILCGMEKSTVIVDDNMYDISFDFECLDELQIQELINILQVKNGELIGKSFSANDAYKSPLLTLMVKIGVRERIKYWEEIEKELEQ